MHNRMRCVGVALTLLFLLLPACKGMNLKYYDVDSLVYLSTDIVVATISKDERHELTAVVSDTLHGSLRPGDRVERLTPFLSFFRPMQDGMKVILFLDRRPRQYDFFHAEAAKSPFAVPPSGVYLIDEYEHVHEYYQQNNPGPYVAQGYSFFIQQSVPSKEQNLALPSLSEKKAVIEASLDSVQSMRPLLDKVVTRDDVPGLFALLDARSDGNHGCSIRAADAIAERVSHQIRELNDPALLLRLQSYHVDQFLDLDFVRPTVSRDPELASARVRYLLQTLSKRRENLSLRIAAAEILRGINRFGVHGGPRKPWVIDNEWLSPFSTELRAIAQRVFEDKAEDAQLRSICLRFLPLDQTTTIADIKRAYLRTRSQQVRFAIEDYFLEFNEPLYESLNPPGGPVTSLVTRAPERSCFRASPSNVAFHAKYREMHKATGSPHYFVVTDLKTGRRMAPAKVGYLGGWSGVRDGESWFELNRPSDIPAGDYSLALEYGMNSKTISVGYKANISVLDTPEGKKILVKNN